MVAQPVTYVAVFSMRRDYKADLIDIFALRGIKTAAVGAMIGAAALIG